MNRKTKQIVLTALFAALTCVATMVIRIPVPSTGGYIHPGDALVILCGIFLGPVYGFLAAGIGSGMADFFGGYFLYVPATFLIKGLIASLTALAYRRVVHLPKGRIVGVVLGGLIDTLLVAGGYFAFEYFFYGWGAVASVIPNTVQGLSGLVIALVLSPALAALPNDMLQQRLSHN